MANYSRAVISRMLSNCDLATTSDAKGAALEALAKYIFCKFPGVSFYAKNTLDANRTHELDVVFSNDQRRSEVYFLEASIIVECKATLCPVGSDGVGWFVRKLQDRGVRVALLISLSGITGAEDGVSNAYSEILSALTRDGIKIILVNREELLSLTDTYSFARLMQSKLMSLITTKTVC